MTVFVRLFDRIWSLFWRYTS